MTLLVFSLLIGFVLLHAVGAGWLTFSGSRERLWERLALLTTATTMVLALVSLLLAYTVPGFSLDALRLGGVWAGALVLEGLCLLAVRRASPRIAATSVAMVLFAVPMTSIVRKAIRVHHRSTHWHCLVRELRNADGTVTTSVAGDED